MGDCLCPYEVCSIHGDNVNRNRPHEGGCVLDDKHDGPCRNDPEAIRHTANCDRNHDAGEFCNGKFSEKLNKSVLQEAEEVINGQRRTDYGSAKVSFERIAGLFSSYLGISIDAHDVAMLMVLLKVARSKQGILNNGEPQRDSLVDIAGYAGCSEKISREV